MKFKVKLNDTHNAKPDQIVDGYLGNIFGDGKIAEYTRGEAIKKLGCLMVRLKNYLKKLSL